MAPKNNISNQVLIKVEDQLVKNKNNRVVFPFTKEKNVIEFSIFNNTKDDFIYIQFFGIMSGNLKILLNNEEIDKIGSNIPFNKRKIKTFYPVSKLPIKSGEKGLIRVERDHHYNLFNSGNSLIIPKNNQNLVIHQYFELKTLNIF